MIGSRLAIAAVVSVACLTGPAHATLGMFADGPFVDLDRLNRCLKGRVDDYTANHGRDRRIWSPALGQKRDLYVYVPPGYDPELRYPVMLWLHGAAQDEKTFMEAVPVFDRRMAAGTFPKCVLVAVDGSSRGRASFKDDSTFYQNSPLGNYEDYVTTDLWNFVVLNYSIRVEREAHVLAGASMGGFGAYNLGIKNRARFGVLVGLMPALNIRYADGRGRSDADFNPNSFQFKPRYDPNEPLARFVHGLVTVRARRLISPVFGEDAMTVRRVAAQNPAEMLTAYDVKPGEFEMFAGYGTQDEFNFDAHVQSFESLAAGRGIKMTTHAVRGGRHNKETAAEMADPLAQWLAPRLEKYAPK